jgi:cytochrome c oxidase subunit 2
MLTKIVVLPEEEFTKWYQGKKQEVAAMSGIQLYQVKGCGACHSTDGSRRVGPTFKGLFGKSEEVTQAGKGKTIVVDEPFIRDHIEDPNVIQVKGYPPIMPKISITNEELTALVDYIKSLK